MRFDALGKLEEQRIHDQGVLEEAEVLLDGVLFVVQSEKPKRVDTPIGLERFIGDERETPCFHAGSVQVLFPQAYEVAAKYLRKIRDIYQKTHRTVEWTTMVKSIRATHKPKRSLMQILDTLEAKRIVDT